MVIEHHEIEFTRDGRVFDEAQVTGLLEKAGGYTDLLVLCHGWNNDKAEASALFDRLTKSLERVTAANLVSGLEDRRMGALRVFWPSKKFADEDLIPGGGAASATHENDEALARLLEAMKHDPETLGGTERNEIREALLSEAQALAPSLSEDPAARERFVAILRSVLDPAEAHADDGSDAFFTRPADELFAGLNGQVVAPGAPKAGGATGVGSGGAAGLGDFLGGVGAAARRLANYTTYYGMKSRAGIVGRVGLAPVLRRLRDRHPTLRLHLVGHSFGGRLVTVAAHDLPPRTHGVTLSLLQAAFSHNGLADNFDENGRDGAFRALLAERRASGPILITHTKNDTAVGIAYPLASRIARQAAAALGDENDPYGGMGRNGAQHTPEVEETSTLLEEAGQDYGFEAGKVYNLRADRFVSSHSDVGGNQVASAILMAVAATGA
ncbi:lipase family protein [Rubellimicrobium rubrum]|uniref:Lipase family protein n=1 Tax=Rubellimicrobium rubrum TaxID=2585369 RepID=A0A5C4MT30_9RHOB|nr:lipase family protein [Rubellimicrobium rubrum]TNC47482.1 lipase family protein [Rubellimicrobium rubrum]